MTHQDLTEEAMEELGSEFFGTAHPTLAMSQATEEVWKANAAVDDDQTNGFKHFDGESFAAGKQRLVTLFDGVLGALRSEDARAARLQLGQALHTLQDFYSHSNWVESGRAGALPSLWRPGESLPAIAAADAPTCEDCELVILSDGSLFLDCGHNLLTPLLTTGYYGGENEVPRVSTKCRHGGPFDTGPGPSGGINKDTYLQALSPHFTLHGQAAESALDASRQFLRDLAAQLTERQLRLLFGAGPTLALALDTSGSMGGGPLSQLALEAARLVDSRLGTEQEPSRYILVPFQGASTPSPRVMGDGSRTLSVPIDSSLSQVTFSLSGGRSLRLTRPDGSPVLGVEPGVRLVPFSTGVLVTVSNPSPGTWTAAMNPSGGYSFRVSGESSARFERFELVELSGRPGHQGYVPLAGLPLSSSALARARLSGDLTSARFELRSRTGTLLQPLALAPEQGGSALEFFGPVDLPSEPFVVYAVGSTRRGEPYQRALGKMPRLQPVRVLAPPSPTLSPGAPTSLSFQVQNSGASNTFRPVLLADPRLPARVTPASLVLGPGETGTFTVHWEVPRNVTPGTAATLTLAVEGLVPGGPHNFAVVEGVVAGRAR